MSSFDDLLKATLGKVNGAYETAYADLNATVASISDSIAKNSGSKVRLRLFPRTEDASGAVLALGLQTSESTITILDFRIPVRGYPIEVGKLETVADVFSQWQRQEAMKSKAELDAYFTKLLASPDSPLIVQLAFLLRKRTK